MATVTNFDNPPSASDVRQDIDAIFKSASLCSMIRFHRTSMFWREESIEQDYCDRILAGKLRLESVADHSWHLSDAALIIAPRFPQLDLNRCVMLAVMHDKLEIWCDDLSPLGRDGSGNKTFAFNSDKRQQRDQRERDAERRYLATLSAPARDLHGSLIDEIIEDDTLAARFVRALDKLQVFVYLIRRKKGDMDNNHVAFNLRYAKKFVDRCEILAPYYEELSSRLISEVARFRKKSISDLRAELSKAVASMSAEQTPLPLDGLGE